MKKRNMTTLVITIIVLLTNLLSVPSVEAALEERGNSTSNINMGGAMVYDGKELYYVSEGEQEQVPGKYEYQYTVSPGIFAKELEGEQESRRVTDTIKSGFESGLRNLNVSSEYIYYIADRALTKDPDRGFALSTEELIVRSKKDGTGKAQVLYASGLEKDLEKFFVVDGWIYYQVTGGDGTSLRYIYRMKPNGKEKKLLLKISDTFFDIKGEWLYHAEYARGSSYIVREKIIGSYKKEQVCELELGVEDILLEGNWIYIKNYNKILKIPAKKNVRASEVKKLVSLGKDATANNFTMVNDGWVYYDIVGSRKVKDELSNEERMEEVVTLYRIKADGTGKKKLCTYEEFYFNYMQILGGYLYSPVAMRSYQEMTIRLKISELKK